MSNDENIAPPPLVRQVAGDLVPPDPLVAVFNQPRDEGRFENGVWIPPTFVPLPNGMDGLTEEDHDNIMRNNGWYVEGDDSSNEYEQEDFPDSSDDEDEEDVADSPLDPPAPLVNNPPSQA